MEELKNVEINLNFEAELEELLGTLPKTEDYEAKIKSFWDMELPETQAPDNRADLEAILKKHHEWLASIRDVKSPVRGMRAVFKHADLRSFDFTGRDLSCADFSGANLEGVSFKNATLILANFDGAKLDGADFSGADIEDTKHLPG